MGIPRFFKLLAERYPLSVERRSKGAVAEYENLYLDMNGIIHMKTHDNSRSKVSTDWDVLSKNVCEYLDVIFDVAQPTELLFLSIDGSVCRMKMNQQRSRRFLKTKEEKGSGINPSSISPGTEFMEHLQEKILKHIEEKRKTNKRWKNVTVVFSGHRVPGEGEHKVVTYIRDTYEMNRNKRHCIHGMDADLILLTLLTALPHFSVLREEMNQKNERTGEFIVLHSHIIREYLSLEMGIGQKSEFAKRVVDDIVLVMTLFGNDFLPGALELIDSFDDVLVLYGKHVRATGKHLHNRGDIDWSALYAFLGEVAEYEKIHMVHSIMGTAPPGKLFTYAGAESTVMAEKKKFYAAAENMLESYTKSEYPTYITKNILAEISAKNSKIKSKVIKNVLLQKTGQAVLSPEGKEALKELAGVPLIEEMPEKEAVQAFWDVAKDVRYKRKEFTKKRAEEYLLGLEWICAYYFQGCPSWSWFYPEHYSVFISDAHSRLREILLQAGKEGNEEVSRILKIEKGYEKGRPLLPFAQLLGILPAEDKNLLPEPLQEVFAALPEYYPKTFETDRDGKMAAWESLCLIPFVEIKRIEEEVAKKAHRLTEREEKRNRVDTLKIWGAGEEQMEEVEINEKTEKAMHAQITRRNSEKHMPAIPSLFFKKIFSNMSRIERPIFQGERKRVVITAMPCSHIIAEINSWMGCRDIKQIRTWVGSDGAVYAGFPYVVPCRIVQVAYKEKVFDVTQDGQVQEGVSENHHKRMLRDSTQDLFRKGGIYIKDRKNYAVCVVKEKEELVVPLEMLIGNANMQNSQKIQTLHGKPAQKRGEE